MDAQFTEICKIVVEHFERNQLFASDTKYFPSTQIQGILCQAALQKTSIEDIAEQKRKEDKTSPTAETVRNAIITHFSDFSRYEFGKYISSLLQAAAMSSPQYRKLRRGPVDFSIDETDLEYAGKDLYIQEEDKEENKEKKKVTFYNRKKQKMFRYATLVVNKKGERPLTIAFLPVPLGQKRKDTVATLLKFAQGMRLKPRLILMDGGFAVTELFQYLDDAKLAWICRGNRMKKREYPARVFEAEFGRKKYRVRSFLVDDRTLLHSSFLYRGSLERVKKDYKRRFQIKHTYRSAKELRVVTSSRSVTYRWAVWSFSLYLELLWKLLCLVALRFGFTYREFRLRLLKRELVKLFSSDAG